MSDQLALRLGDPRAAVGHVRHDDTDTAHAAGRRDHSGIMALVVAALEDHRGGLTDAELVAVCGLPERKRGSVVRRRADAGAVDSGVRRLSPDGCQMIVWKRP